MTKRVLFTLIKHFIDKKIGTYRANVNTSILVMKKMSLFQTIATTIDVGSVKLEISGIVNARD